MSANDLYATLIKEEHSAINKLLDKMTADDLKIPIAEDETIGDRLKHMAGAEYKMAGYFKNDVNGKLEVDVSLDGLRKAFEDSKARHLAMLDDLDMSNTDKIWASPTSGKEYSYGFLLWHYLEHLSTHRGQCTMRIRQSKEA